MHLLDPNSSWPLGFEHIFRSSSSGSRLGPVLIVNSGTLALGSALTFS
ncbi:uncharacterized protein CLUP02_04852 [Colletotrichum lupini]|uniref:Uncharacterized protein n=1 Tax=Colletotrichum lupini TaxID=145971 RepID=A0A9Q8WD51_9PEZI|nr:uncharacterized protein CLUP02_04852 [Colletotrichum lupini]UQC79373.1 hypothetical protein CLUP02_04852 [Colletotrichum lupini]